MGSLVLTFILALFTALAFLHADWVDTSILIAAALCIWLLCEVIGHDLENQ